MGGDPASKCQRRVEDSSITVLSEVREAQAADKAATCFNGEALKVIGGEGGWFELDLQNGPEHGRSGSE